MKGSTIALLCGGALLAAAAATRAIVARMTSSPTAKAKGIDNAPDTDEERANVIWTGQWIDPVLALVREVDPAADFSSGYRSDQLNAEVRGVSSSLHCIGLGFDLRTSLPFRCAHHLRVNLHRLPAELQRSLREVIAETARGNHVHVGLWNGRVGQTGACEWLGEYTAGKFETLRAEA